MSVQAAFISPDVFKGKTVAEIANLPVTEGNHQLKLCDLFEKFAYQKEPMINL